MKAIIQYVSQASVTVDDREVGSIQKGFAILVGFTHSDTTETVVSMAQKILKLRIIPDLNDHLNRSITDTNGQLLIIPQFTLYADTSKGNRPNFSKAMKPNEAHDLFEEFVQFLCESDQKVATGQFGSHMNVSLTNTGPITITLEN